MRKATGWDYHLGTAGMNSSAKKYVLIITIPFPLLQRSQIPSGLPS